MLNHSVILEDIFNGKQNMLYQQLQWADTMPSNHWVLIDDSYIICWLPNSTDNGSKSYRHPNFRDAETWGGRYTLIDKTVVLQKYENLAACIFYLIFYPQHTSMSISVSALLIILDTIFFPCVPLTELIHQNCILK